MARHRAYEGLLRILRVCSLEEALTMQRWKPEATLSGSECQPAWYFWSEGRRASMSDELANDGVSPGRGHLSEVGDCGGVGSSCMCCCGALSSA